MTFNSYKQVLKKLPYNCVTHTNPGNSHDNMRFMFRNEHDNYGVLSLALNHIFKADGDYYADGDDFETVCALADDYITWVGDAKEALTWFDEYWTGGDFNFKNAATAHLKREAKKIPDKLELPEGGWYFEALKKELPGETDVTISKTIDSVDYALLLPIDLFMRFVIHSKHWRAQPQNWVELIENGKRLGFAEEETVSLSICKAWLMWRETQ